MTQSAHSVSHAIATKTASAGLSQTFGKPSVKPPRLAPSWHLAGFLPPRALHRSQNHRFQLRSSDALRCKIRSPAECARLHVDLHIASGRTRFVFAATLTKAELPLRHF